MTYEGAFNNTGRFRSPQPEKITSSEFIKLVCKRSGSDGKWEPEVVANGNRNPVPRSDFVDREAEAKGQRMR